MSVFFLLSPAKTLNWDAVPAPVQAMGLSTPAFKAQAEHLMALLRDLSAQEIAQLMHLSPALTSLNQARYAAFSHQPESEPDALRPAFFAFDGDVYQALQARTLSSASLAWAQKSVRILSGLYGILRPLDGIQAHRLEMGTRLNNPAGPNLYAYWLPLLGNCLQAQAESEAEVEVEADGMASCHVINLASSEYSQAVDRASLKIPVIDVVFQEPHADTYRVVGIHAKQARGKMLRWAIEQRLTRAQELWAFNERGYRFCEAQSTPHTLVFRRS
jgi:cytoplasmic iron level regulating protein YaaA (DUF328/UPF0246 family)